MTKALISLTYGNVYHLRQYVDEFISANGLSKKDIVRIEGDNCTEAVIKSESASMSIFDLPRVIVVDNFFSTKKTKISEEFYLFLKNFDGQNYVLFLENSAVPASVLKKLDRASVKIVECSGDKKGLRDWFIKEGSNQGITLTNSQATLLENLLGSDSDFFRLNNELQKLASYNQSEISDQLIRKLYKKADQFSNIFAVTDAFGERKYANILKSLSDLTDQEGSPVYVLVMVIRQFRNIILVKELVSKGLKEEEIAKKLGIHPYVVKKSIAQASRYTFSDLKKVYSMLVETDASLKTGGDINTELSLISYWVGEGR
jgi:DNA polymerase-3 subunit delta